MSADEPIDPDTTLAPWPTPSRLSAGQQQVVLLGTIALGGMIGAALRYGAAVLWPTAAGSFSWTTLFVNVIGCFAMGVLMVLITEKYDAHPLVRPFVGTGVLGGFTTFSTYAVDARDLFGQSPLLALLYLASTLIVALVAVWLGAALARRVS